MRLKPCYIGVSAKYGGMFYDLDVPSNLRYETLFNPLRGPDVRLLHTVFLIRFTVVMEKFITCSKMKSLIISWDIK